MGTKKHISKILAAYEKGSLYIYPEAGTIFIYDTDNNLIGSLLSDRSLAEKEVRQIEKAISKKFGPELPRFIWASSINVALSKLSTTKNK